MQWDAAWKKGREGGKEGRKRIDNIKKANLRRQMSAIWYSFHVPRLAKFENIFQTIPNKVKENCNKKKKKKKIQVELRREL